MSGKRRKKQAARRPPVRSAASPVSAPPTAVEDAATVRPTAPPVAARSESRPAPPARYAGNVTAPRRGGTAVATTGTIDIDERVPYFAQDLRRIMVTAGLMVVAIIAGSFLLH